MYLVLHRPCLHIAYHAVNAVNNGYCSMLCFKSLTIITSGYFSNSEMIDELESHLRDQLNWPEKDFSVKDLILNYSNNQFSIYY